MTQKEVKKRQLSHEEKSATERGLNILTKGIKEVNDDLKDANFKLDFQYEYSYKKQRDKLQAVKKEMLSSYTTLQQKASILSDQLKNGVPINGGDNE